MHNNKGKGGQYFRTKMVNDVLQINIFWSIICSKIIILMSWEKWMCTYTIQSTWKVIIPKIKLMACWHAQITLGQGVILKSCTHNISSIDKLIRSVNQSLVWTNKHGCQTIKHAFCISSDPKGKTFLPIVNSICSNHCNSSFFLCDLM